MEIGVHNGWGARHMITAAKRGDMQVEYYGFDTFCGTPKNEPEPNQNFVVSNIKEIRKILSNLNVRFHLYKGNTQKTLPREVPNLPRMDFIFIDGGHSYETVESDWKNVKKLMHDGTCVVFDDYHAFEGVTRAVNEIGGYNIRIIPLRRKNKALAVVYMS